MTNLLSPNIGGIPPILFADFTTEGTTNNYWANSALQANFSAWLSSLSGTFTRASAASYINSSGVLTQASSGQIRFDYDPVSLTPKGILLEGSSTNVALQSNNFNTTWILVAGALAANNSGVDGGATAWLFTQDGTNNIHGVLQSTTLTGGSQYTISVYAKAGTGSNGSFIGFYDATDTGDNAQFNLSNGTVVSTTGSGVTASITRAPNGFYRCSMTYTAGGSGSHSVNLFIFQGNGTSGTVSYTGDGASNVLWTFFQAEALAFASSYIPTTTGTVTRAADKLISTSVTPTSASVFIEWTPQSLGNDPIFGANGLWDIETNGAGMDVFNTSGELAFRGVGLNADVGQVATMGDNRNAAAFQVGSVNVVSNGGSAFSTATFSTMPNGNLVIGTARASCPLWGWVKIIWVLE